jgi:hypothetical protein
MKIKKTNYFIIQSLNLIFKRKIVKFLCMIQVVNDQECRNWLNFPMDDHHFGYVTKVNKINH